MGVLGEIVGWLIGVLALVGLLGATIYGLWTVWGWVLQPHSRPVRVLTGVAYVLAAVIALLGAAALGALIQLLLIGRG